MYLCGLFGFFCKDKWIFKTFLGVDLISQLDLGNKKLDENEVLRNWVFVTNSDFLISMSLQPNFVDFWYFKLIILCPNLILEPYSCCSFFLHNSKSIGLRLLKFSNFSYIPKALPLGLKPGFNTNCLSPQANCLNDCFFL